MNSNYLHFILILSILGSIFSSTPLYSVDRNTTFLGFNMGILSDTVINMILSKNGHYAISNAGVELSSEDKLVLFPNEDTNRPYHENLFNYNCLSYNLGTPNNNYSGGYRSLLSIKYNKLIIDNPKFYFDNNALVGLVGNINLHFSDYNDMISLFDKKYGKNKFNGRLYSWNNGEHVITLQSPNYDLWRRNKKYNWMANQNTYPHKVYFQFYDKARVIDCLAKREEDSKKVSETFFEVRNNKIFILGLSIGFSKEEFLKRLQEMELNYAPSFCNISSFYDLKNTIDTSNNISCAPSFKRSISNQTIGLTANFISNKLASLRIEVNPIVNSNRYDFVSSEIYSIVKKHINKHKLTYRKLHDKNGYVYDDITFKVNDVYVNISYQNTHGIRISLY
jgi:hypothetical protein